MRNLARLLVPTSQQPAAATLFFPFSSFCALLLSLLLSSVALLSALSDLAFTAAQRLAAVNAGMPGGGGGGRKIHLSLSEMARNFSFGDRVAVFPTDVGRQLPPLLPLDPCPGLAAEFIRVSSALPGAGAGTRVT